jgi:integrase
MVDQNEFNSGSDGQTDYNIGSDPARIIEGFKDYLIRNGLAQRSIEEYVKIARQFLFSIGMNILNINLKAFENFFKYKKNSQRIASIKNLCDYLEIKDFEVFKKNNRKFLKSHYDPIRKSLNENDMKALIHQLPYPYNIIGLIQWDCGLRISAVLNLQVENYNKDYEGLFYITVKEKGNKSRTRYLSEETSIAINNHLIATRITNGFMFPLGNIKNAYNKYNKILNQVSAMNGIFISSHAIRRSRAVNLINQGKDIITVKNFLGHSDPKTTFIYVELAGQSSRDIIKEERMKRQQINQ